MRILICMQNLHSFIGILLKVLHDLCLLLHGVLYFDDQVYVCVHELIRMGLCITQSSGGNIIIFGIERYDGMA